MNSWNRIQPIRVRTVCISTDRKISWTFYDKEFICIAESMLYMKANFRELTARNRSLFLQTLYWLNSSKVNTLR